MTPVKSFFLLATSLLGFAFIQPSAEARPFLYMSSFEYNGPYKTCITNAEKVMRAHGFTRDLEVKEDANNKYAVVYAFKDGESMTAEIQCSQKDGISLLGVAGLDNQTTWELFQKLEKAQW